MKWSFTHFKLMGPHVMRHYTIGENELDYPSIVVFLNMLLINITVRTTFITVHYIPFQILNLDFAFQYRKVSFGLFLTFFWETIERV